MKNYENIEKAILELKAGKMVILTDHHTREDEGDFVLAAQFATSKKINLMASWGRGLICAPLEKSKAQELNLPLMVQENDSNHETAFTISIDAKNNISTGISAHDRAYTLKLLAAEKCDQADFVKPGHIFPLIAKGGGVEERPGHTEATVDLLKLAGLTPVGVICEIMNEEGEMARGEELKELSRKFEMPLISIEELLEYKKFLRAPADQPEAKLINLKEFQS